MNRRENMPALVYYTLLSIYQRWLALSSLWICLGLALCGLTAAALFYMGWPQADASCEGRELADYLRFMGFVSLPVSLAAVAAYAYALRWVDRHSSWN